MRGMRSSQGEMPRLEGTWDRYLDPDATRARLLKLMAEDEARASRSVRARRRLAKLCVLLTQLDNASRVSEAHEAFRTWLERGRPLEDRRVRIRVRKQRKKPERRIIKIPIEAAEAAIRADLKPEDVGTPHAIMCLAQRLGMNTHSLRYAGITKMALSGLTDAIIGKITGHKKLDMIRTYIQRLKAEELLDEMVP